MAYVVTSEKAEEKLVVVVRQVGFPHSALLLVVLEVWHEEEEHALTDDDDEEEVDSTHKCAVCADENICGVVDSECKFEGCEVGVAAGVKPREHTSDIGIELRVGPSAEEESEGDGDGASENAEDGRLDECGRKSCPGSYVGGEEQEWDGEGDGIGGYSRLGCMHLWGVGDKPGETEEAADDVCYDDAPYFVEYLELAGEPEDQQRGEDAEDNDEG